MQKSIVCFLNIMVCHLLVEIVRKSPMNIMLIPQNGKMLDFFFCNFKCVVASKVQPTMDNSSIIMN